MLEMTRHVDGHVRVQEVLRIIRLLRSFCRGVTGLGLTPRSTLFVSTFGTRHASDGACPILRAPCNQLFVPIDARFRALL